MPSKTFAITSEQRDFIVDTITELDTTHFKSGVALFQKGTVGNLRWDKEGHKILTAVQCRGLYRVEISTVDDDLPMACSCPAEGICKHLVAALLKIRIAPVVKKGARSSVKPTKHPVNDEDARTPEKLSRRAEHFLKQALIWGASNARQIGSNDLKEAAGEKSIWHTSLIEIFPPENPPADQEEYFAYLVAACQANQIVVPEPLADTVNPETAKRLEENWKRLKEIKKWKVEFDKWDSPGASTAAPDVDFRLQLSESGAVVQMRVAGKQEFENAPSKFLTQFLEKSSFALNAIGPHLVLEAAKDEYGSIRSSDIRPMHAKLSRSLTQLSASKELFDRHVVGKNGAPLQISTESLRWQLTPPENPAGDYQLTLLDESGLPPLSPVAILSGRPLKYLTAEAIYPIPTWPFGEERPSWPIQIPSPALESYQGLGALVRLQISVPEHMAKKVRTLAASIVVTCRIYQYFNSSTSYFQLCAKTDFDGYEKPLVWSGTNWWARNIWDFKPKTTGDDLIQIDKSAMTPAAEWIASIPLKQGIQAGDKIWHEQRIVGKDWPDQFIFWLERRPEGCIVELDAELASLRQGKVAGHVRIDIEDSKDGIDWFDLSVALHVDDTTLTQEEINLLLKAKGKWVRIEGKGWRKLEYQLTEEQLKELAELGLSVNEFSNEKQRLHALQLAGLTKKNTSLLGADRVAQVRRRVEEIQTRVTPPAPDAITATLRPYQLEGFHFLAYLTANNFGGVLADDMGLGKTLQALSWIAWLRKEGKITGPVLVVCPKSVQDNWANECGKFFPELKVDIWSRDKVGKTGLDGSVDLLVINYPQLRLHEEVLRAVSWGAVILDEAQAIKNPTSQNARAACALPSKYRLALSGTPIENRLLDLWSIFAFAMPGALGNRAAFTKQFDKKDDPFARRRLAARTRPFLLRRTKNEVARDLPDRVEEDLVVEFEGVQSALYKAEIKRARAQLLKIETAKQLDKMRFNILTSLLRLRQICCHPRLLGLEDTKKTKSADTTGDSAKLSALLELLEPLMEEGQKVLVFSQFVEMLEIIESEIKARKWTTFKLTGSTNDRGPLVDSFQKHEGSAVFLISLKAGGSGLNLTAASYVVLFDPWWNPAVEAQAIDRTHRIGQKQTVFAYRLIIKGTIEEKIRLLQKKKGALANDILGEENFARALTLEDFNFLFSDAGEE